MAARLSPALLQSPFASSFGMQLQRLTGAPWVIRLSARLTLNAGRRLLDSSIGSYTGWNALLGLPFSGGPVPPETLGVP